MGFTFLVWVGMFVPIQMLEPASAAVAVYVVSESPRLFRKLRGSRCTSVLRRYHEVCLWFGLLYSVSMGYPTDCVMG
jgi:hypothetical protein